MSRKCITLSEPLGWARRPTPQSCFCLDFKMLPLPKKQLSSTDSAAWAPNLQGMGTKSIGITDGIPKYHVLSHSVWTEVMQPGSCRSSCTGLGTQDTLELMKLSTLDQVSHRWEWSELQAWKPQLEQMWCALETLCAPLWRQTWSWGN